jgi:HlyD family secretion protein
MLTSLTLQLVRYQRQAEDALGRYLRLTQPPDPEDVAVAQANLALAQAQLAQAQRDWEQVKDGTSPADLALLHAQLEDARRQAERLEAGADPEEVAAAQARVAAAEATLEMARQVAPFDGVITEIYALPADQVVPGDLAFRLDDLSKLLVELHISEVDINRIQTGQAVTLTLDSAPGSAYRGRVVEVSPVAEVQGGVAAFLVKAEIENADESIRPGMTAGAEIITAEFKDVLLVPASAVRMLQGQRVVYVLRDGKPEAVSVALGASSAGEVQVIEGDVQPGDAIVLNLEGLE